MWPAGTENPLAMMTHDAALFPSLTRGKACRTKGGGKRWVGEVWTKTNYNSYKASNTTVTVLQKCKSTLGKATVKVISVSISVSIQSALKLVSCQLILMISFRFVFAILSNRI